MRDSPSLRSRLRAAAVVVVPPLLGAAAYFGPVCDGTGDFVDNYLYVASPSLVWWLLSRWIPRRVFFGGLLGLHAMTGLFLLSMFLRWGDDLSWQLYFPAEVVGLLAGIGVSLCATRRVPK